MVHGFLSTTASRVHLLLEKISNRERSPRKLALTVCLGIYIGLSPFIGLRTVLTFACGWLFAMDLVALFTASFFVHNPWTMIPLCTLNHFIGQALFSFLSIDGMRLDPWWVEQCSVFLTQHTGISGLSLSAFLVGGNLLGIGISVMLYPFIKRILTVYLSKKNTSVTEIHI